MSIKKLAILGLFLGLFWGIHAQSTPKHQIQWGEIEKIPSSICFLTDVVYAENGEFYALFDRPAALKLIIKKHRKDLTLEKELTLNMHGKYGKRFLQFTIQTKDKIYLYVSEKDRDNDRHVLIRETFDKGSFQLLKEESVELMDVPYSAILLRTKKIFSHRLSPDSSKVLVFARSSFERNEFEDYKFIVFDQQLKNIWSKKVSVPYLDKHYVSEEFQVDNMGNVYQLGTMKRLEKPENVNYKYELFIYKQEAKTPDKFEFNSKGNFFTKMKTAIDQDNNIICAGFYSKENSLDKDGAFYIRMNPQTKQILSSSFKEFDIDFITLYEKRAKQRKDNRKEEKGKSVELEDYYFQQLVLRENGQALLIGEKRYITHSSGGPQSPSSTSYHYDEILVISIDTKGDISWYKKISKRETASVEEYYSSYAILVNNSNQYFLFNDNEKNLQLEKGERATGLGIGAVPILSMVTLDSEGNEKRESLFQVTKKETLYPRPLVFKQIAPNKMIIYTKKGKKTRFGLLEIEEG